jgi:hypothetical protein
VKLFGFFFKKLEVFEALAEFSNFLRKIRMASRHRFDARVRVMLEDVLGEVALDCFVTLAMTIA